MIDDGEPDGGGEQPFARTYDFYKYLTGIALVSTGGVFAFLTGDGPVLDTRRTVIVLAALGISGVTSLLIAAFLAGLEVKPMPHRAVAKRVRMAGFVAVFFLAVGLGSFVQAFSSAMLK